MAIAAHMRHHHVIAGTKGTGMLLRDDEQAEILVNKSGSMGQISLNRPKALNSLTLGMVRGIETALDTFEADPGVALVLVTGEGDRGLSAGGDIRMIYESGKTGTPLAETFWREEYRLNSRIARFPKPYVAIMDGIVMGGGVGISAHGSHRIVTDRTRLAMPETGIGFFPDVGATWLLSRPNREWGTYLGLTGVTAGAAAALAAGLADLHVPHARLGALVAALSDLPADTPTDRIDQLLAGFSTPPAAEVAEDMRAVVEKAFARQNVEDILDALADTSGEFAAATRALLLTRSPTSLKVTLRLLRQARASQNLDACLAMEFAATHAVLQSPDFYEGIRAAVIDKDRNPKWVPATLTEVDQNVIDSYFAPHPRPLFEQ